MYPTPITPPEPRPDSGIPSDLCRPEHDGLRLSARFEVWAVVGGQTTTYTWDVRRGLPVALRDRSTTYVWGEGLVSQTDSQGTTSYLLSDGLGSTRAITDSQGTFTATLDYDVFGAVLGLAIGAIASTTLLTSLAHAGPREPMPTQLWAARVASVGLLILPSAAAVTLVGLFVHPSIGRYTLRSGVLVFAVILVAVIVWLTVAA